MAFASNYQDVLDQLLAFGLHVQSLEVGTTRPVRCKIEGGGRERRGWYILHELPTSDGGMLIVGSYGVWRANENHAQKVELKKSDPISAEQRAALKKRLVEDRKRADAIRAREAEAAAKKAASAWARLEPDGDSEYLAKKGVRGHGLRYTRNGSAVLPLIDGSGRIHGLQFLRSARQATEARRPAKEFWPAGLIKKGHFHLIGPAPTWVILIAEGYATAASLLEATGYPVAVAFDAGNLAPVARALRQRHKTAKILICADDDAFTEGNPGVGAASAAALEVGGEWLAPTFADDAARRERHEKQGHKLTDFNDLAQLETAVTVRTKVEARLSALGWKAENSRAVSSSTTGAGGVDKLRPIEHLDDLIGRYALVYASGGAVFDRREHCLLPLTDMRNACIRTSLHKAWMEHPAREIVRSDEVGFDPGSDDPRVTCNLWGGWPTAPAAGACDKLLDLLRYICSGEANSYELYDWVLKWIAYPIQHPGAKMKTTVVVHGPQGAGKNLFFEAVMGIYGKYGRILDQDALVDKHNDWASRKLFLIADEVVAQAHRFELKNKLKTLITGTWVRINPKHIAAYDEANHVNLVFLSNETMPAVLEEDDRRHCVIWTPPAKAEAYYTAVRAELGEGGIAALHDHLLHLDLGDFHPGTRPPDTAAKRELIDLAQDSPVEFVDALVRRDVHGMELMPGLTQDWFTAYTRWCSGVGVKPASLKRFVSTIDKRRGVRADRKRYLLGAEVVGPHSVLMFSLDPPEGHTESTWLGARIEAMRARLADTRGGFA